MSPTLTLTEQPDLTAASPCLHPQNPDIVLVHYLNVPAIEDCGKPCGPILCSINTDKKEWAKWTKEELIGQLKPMCEYRKRSRSYTLSTFVHKTAAVSTPKALKAAACLQAWKKNLTEMLLSLSEDLMSCPIS